jgi:hypothetical protein
MVNLDKQFLEACKYGQIEEAKRLTQDHQVDVHADNESAFRQTCAYGHIDIAKWLVNDHQVDVGVNNGRAFIWVFINYKMASARTPGRYTCV